MLDVIARVRERVSRWFVVSMQKNSLDPETIQGVWHVISFPQPHVHFHVRNGRVGMQFQYVY
jgi:hypothetical protein